MGDGTETGGRRGGNKGAIFKFESLVPFAFVYSVFRISYILQNGYHIYRGTTDRPTDRPYTHFLQISAILPPPRLSPPPCHLVRVLHSGHVRTFYSALPAQSSERHSTTTHPDPRSVEERASHVYPKRLYISSMHAYLHVCVCTCTYMNVPKCFLTVFLYFAALSSTTYPPTHPHTRPHARTPARPPSPPSAVQYITVHLNTIQYTSIQYSKIQYSSVHSRPYRYVRSPRSCRHL